MPRQVDHERRRRQVAAAVCAIVAERGTAAASLRNVAAQAGVSTGAVQRCFATSGEMIIFALDQLNDGITERLQAILDRAPDDSSGTPGARATLDLAAREIALLGSETDTARMWLAFHAHAAAPVVAARLRTDEANALETLTMLIHHGRETAELDPDLDPAREARLLMATLDGIAVQLALDVLDHESARLLVDHATSRLRNTRRENVDAHAP